MVRSQIPQQELSCLIRDMPYHIFNSTGKNVTQIVQGGCGNVPVMLQGVKRPTAEGIFLYQRIGRYPFAPHCLPEWVISDHRNHLFNYGSYYI